MYNPFELTDAAKAKHTEPDPFGRIRADELERDDEIADVDDPADLKQPVGDQGRNDRRDVAKAETMLGKAGALDLEKTKGPTGYWGLRTDDATRTFQKQHGLKVDGRINPGGETIRKLAEVAGSVVKALAQPAPQIRHSREGGNPDIKQPAMDYRLRGDDGGAKANPTYMPLPDDAIASNRRTADALGKIKGVGDLPRFTVDAINAHGERAIREVADLIGQVHARSPDQARELFARIAHGISPANRAALMRLGSGPHEDVAAPESEDTRNPSADLPPAQARKEARETVADRRDPLADIEHAARVNLTGTPQEVKDNLSALSQKYRSEGYTYAADNLDHFLNGRGEPVTVSRDDARKDPFIRNAELENQKRFEARSFLGNSGKEDNNRKLRALKDGETIHLDDHWDVEKGVGGLAADAVMQGKAGMDDILADGERNFKSIANFTATRRGDKIHISGTTNHDGTENYDFETDGLGHLIGAKGLAEIGLGDNFEINRKWDQTFEGTVEIVHTSNGVDLTNPRFKWHDTLPNEAKP